MNFPEDLFYTKDHEWIRPAGNGNALVGITDFAQGELGDIVFLEIETVGKSLEQGALFGTVEAVKTVSDLFSPVSCEVLEANPRLASEPELVNKDPYGEGWLIRIKMKDVSELESLMKAEEYGKTVGGNQ